MDTKREGPADETDLFIKQCEAVRVGVNLRAMNRKGKPANFGRGAAIELLHAIGRLAAERGLEIKVS